MHRYSPEEKVRLVALVLEKKSSISVIAKSANVSYETLNGWVRNYLAMGEEAFYRKGWTKRSAIEKEAAVIAYLSGSGSLRDICKEFKISDTRQLRQWILKYNSHEELKSSGTGGRTIMTKGRKTTFDERVEIVEYCIAHDKNYMETSEKFGVSYQQARNYTIKYEESGVEGLKDNRGRRKSEDEMDELEKLRAEVKLLRAAKERAEMEISFLKKLEEIERRRG